MKSFASLPKYFALVSILLLLNVTIYAQFSFESSLPIIVINTNGVSIQDEPKITALMGIIDNGPGAINHLEDSFNGYNGFIGIEIRGNSSQMFPKKSYSVETRDSIGSDLKVSLLGMPEESDWVLYAPYSDKSMLRNSVSFELGRRMQDIYCSRVKFCEVVVNNDYRGVYVLMEKIKRDENRVNIAKLNPDDVTGDDVTGGYILAVDWRDDDFIYGYDGWVSRPEPPYPGALNITFQHFYPEPEVLNQAQRSYIHSFITRAENALTGANFSSSEQGYHKYFDVPSFVDLMLLNEISKEVDKYRLSQYFFKEKDSDGGKLFAGPAWDFDLGYGNVDYWSPGIEYYGWVYTDIHTWDYSIVFWWKRLMEDIYFKNLVYTRWQNLRQEALSDYKVHTLVDSLVAEIEIPKERNYERWPILGTYIWPNYDWQGNDYNDEVSYFENFLFNRLHWMDNNITGKIISPQVNITGNGNTLTISLVGDYFRNPILKPEYFTINNSASGLKIIAVKYLDAHDCLLTLNGDVTGNPILTVTVDEEAINTWENITSHELIAAGFYDDDIMQEISVFENDNKIFIRTDAPEKLPLIAEFINLNGQIIAKYQLEKQNLNAIDLDLNEGLYLLVLWSESGRCVLKFAVTK